MSGAKRQGPVCGYPSNYGDSEHEFTNGDKVKWIRGAVGLTGTVIGFLNVQSGDSTNNVLVHVQTVDGDFYEYPRFLAHQ